MALNKKKSRKIVVDCECYRYAVSATSPDEDWNFRLNVTLQHENGGCRLEIRGLVTRDYWLDFPNSGELRSEDYPVVTPRHIRAIIYLAIQKGWKPQITGSPFVLELSNEQLFSSNEQ